MLNAYYFLIVLFKSDVVSEDSAGISTLQVD